jgi:hypothetical protein
MRIEFERRVASQGFGEVWLAAGAVLDLCTLNGSFIVACGHTSEDALHTRDHCPLAALGGRSRLYVGTMTVVSEGVNQEREAERYAVQDQAWTSR